MNTSMSSKEKNQEQTVVMSPLSSTDEDVITITALRNALDQLAISAHQKESILKQLIAPPPAAAPTAAPSASTVPNLSAVTTVVTDKAAAATAAAADDDVDTTHGDDDIMDDEKDAYGDDDDDDDDSEYDGNVQYPYPKSKIQYDSDEDSVVDYELSQQVSFN